MTIESWRLIQTSPARGAWNMALDEAIWEACMRGDSPPVLRLYAWRPPCLSLGYAQPLGDVDQERLDALGWDLVRRPTGGGAILHTDELTYAVLGPARHPLLAGSVLESYRRLARALLMALRLLGLPAEMNEESLAPEQAVNPVCFEAPSAYEITVGGKKLIGSAQARRKDGVLQHGALPLGGDLTRIVQVLAFPDETARRRAAERLLQRATTVEQALGRSVPWETAAQAFVDAFRQTFSLCLKPSEPTVTEQARAEELVRIRYANPAWSRQGNSDRQQWSESISIVSEVHCER